MAKTEATVELYYDGGWHDITSDAYVRDGIRITRGRPDEVSRIPPSTLSLTLDNRDGTYSPRNGASALYGLIGRNTPIRVAVRRVYDAFGRTATDSWGTADSGHPWTATGTATNFSVASGTGRIITTTTAQYATTGTFADIDVTATCTVPATATGNGINTALVARFTDSSNFYYLLATADTSGTLDISVRTVVAGADTALDSANDFMAYSGGVGFKLRFQVIGNVLRGKAWAAADDEPETWTVEGTDTDSSFTSGAVGVRTRLLAGNTNTAPVTLTFDDLVARTVRFHGEIESWPQRGSVDGNDAWVPITANGILRRLNAPGVTQRARSCLYLAIVGIFAVEAPVMYYPLETGPQSGLSTGAPLTTTGSVPYGTGPVAPGSGGGADFSYSGRLSGPTGLAGDAIADWEAELVIGVNNLPSTRAGANIRRVVAFRTPESTVTEVGIAISAEDETTWYIGAFYSTSGSSTNFVSDLNTILVPGHAYHVRLFVEQDGGNIEITPFVDGVQEGFTGLAATVTEPDFVVLNDSAGAGANPSADMTSVSHLGLWAPARAAVPDNSAATQGNSGETAGARMTRLCAEDGITFEIVGDTADTQLVGPELFKPTIEKLLDAADADGGILYEPREFFGLAYRTHDSLYNQDATIALDFADGGEVAPPLDMVEDTDATVNDATVTRYGGGSAGYVQDTGPLNVQEPIDDPDGVGRYGQQVTRVLASDAQCAPWASWLVHLGTFDGPRYPVVNLDLTAMGVEGKTTLIGQAVTLNVGDRLTITNTPTWLPPEDIEQHAQGFVEEIGSHRWTIAVNATPAEPYDVGIYGSEDDPDGDGPDRYDTWASETTADFDSGTDTSMSIVSVGVRWTEDADDLPFNILCGGVVLEVTAVSGAALAQTMTITQTPVNGVEKTIPSGTALSLARPAYYALGG